MGWVKLDCSLRSQIKLFGADAGYQRKAAVVPVPNSYGVNHSRNQDFPCGGGRVHTLLAQKSDDLSPISPKPAVYLQHNWHE